MHTEAQPQTQHRRRSLQTYRGVRLRLSVESQSQKSRIRHTGARNEPKVASEKVDCREVGLQKLIRFVFQALQAVLLKRLKKEHGYQSLQKNDTVGCSMLERRQPSHEQDGMTRRGEQEHGNARQSTQIRRGKHNQLITGCARVPHCGD